MRHSIDSVPDPSDESFVAFSCWTQELLHPFLRHFFVKSGTLRNTTPTLPLPDVVKSTPTGRYFWINLENASEEKAALWGREEQPSLQVNTLPTFKPLNVWPANWPLGIIFGTRGVEFKEALQIPKISEILRLLIRYLYENPFLFSAFTSCRGRTCFGERPSG